MDEFAGNETDETEEIDDGTDKPDDVGGEPAKAPKIEIIPRADADGVERAEYAMLDELIKKNHPHLCSPGLEARIVLAWRSGWSVDKDGRLQLGKAAKASELNRKLHGYDFVILLNREAWLEQDDFSEQQKRALLDHELTHCSVDLGDEGEPAIDKTGRPKWRIRKHDIEEFGEVVQRNGLWTNSLEEFTGLLAAKRRTRRREDAETRREETLAGTA